MKGFDKCFIREEDKMSIEECKRLLNKGKTKYSEEEVKAIRDFIYIMAEIDYQEFVRRNYQDQSK